MKTGFFSAICLALILNATHCSKRALIRNYYILESKQEFVQQKLNSLETFPFKVDVRDFRVTKAFDQTRMAVRTSSHELNYYFYHHWAVKPATTIADMVYQLIDQIDLFKRCSREYTSDTDYIITGHVHKIERVEGKKYNGAHLSITFELIESNSGLPVVRYNFDKESPLDKDRTMNQFAYTISKILTEEVVLFTYKISDYFNNTTPKNTE